MSFTMAHLMAGIPFGVAWLGAGKSLHPKVHRPTLCIISWFSYDLSGGFTDFCDGKMYRVANPDGRMGKGGSSGVLWMICPGSLSVLDSRSSLWGL
jgi:hypothetical protein